MKFSRNPKSGVLEAYTDDGEFIGVVNSFGDKTDDGDDSEKDDN